MSKGREQMKRHQAKYKKLRKGFNTNELVLKRRHKLSNKALKRTKKLELLYEGPYQILKIKMDNAYLIKNIKNGRKATVNARPYYRR